MRALNYLNSQPSDQDMVAKHVNFLRAYSINIETIRNQTTPPRVTARLSRSKQPETSSKASSSSLEISSDETEDETELPGTFEYHPETHPIQQEKP